MSSLMNSPQVLTARLAARPQPSSKLPAAIAGNAAALSPAGANGYHSSSQFVSHALQAIALSFDNSNRDSYLYVPPTYNPSLPSPLLVMLHGAGGHGPNTLATFGALSVFDASRCLLLVPESRSSRTWDMIRGSFGPDVAHINSSLQYVFERYSVDPSRLGIAGFSDGASYALSLGLPNGDLFSHIIAFSPGFMRPPCVAGSPKVYISHGVHDEVLPIERCSRRLLPSLKQMLPQGEVHYVEFNGPHVVPAGISQEALLWFTNGEAPVTPN
uniref:Phospholipase/carboxylesterase/thioesterase domain-containing protein n=1 Tax=Tetradesmus obliquus TaxID=3088 RepID=A0A383W169_TETOB|eukprot:jgi/Sobl393_1/20048/SZX71438.1